MRQAGDNSYPLNTKLWVLHKTRPTNRRGRWVTLSSPTTPQVWEQLSKLRAAEANSTDDDEKITTTKKLKRTNR